ncbi:UNVERIFIED_CONTAM: hypothetical protein NCL1_10614 [Trichonephila clavipes]
MSKSFVNTVNAIVYQRFRNCFIDSSAKRRIVSLKNAYICQGHLPYWLSKMYIYADGSYGVDVDKF